MYSGLTHPDGLLADVCGLVLPKEKTSCHRCPPMGPSIMQLHCAVPAPFHWPWIAGVIVVQIADGRRIGSCTLLYSLSKSTHHYRDGKQALHTAKIHVI